jgi:hypothetical protein
MTNSSEFVLKPGLGIDLVFDLDSESPSSRSSIIFEHSPSYKQVIVAQPRNRIIPESGYKQMHISSLVYRDISAKVRLGYSCRITEVIKDYKLSNQSLAEALIITYDPEVIEMNIRSAFRFQPTPSFDVVGKMVINHQIFYSDRQFKFHDISNNGTGLLIPKIYNKERNPILDIKSGSRGAIGMILKLPDGKAAAPPIECDIKIIRMNLNHNAMSAFAGCSLLGLKLSQEESLNRFIHKAQLHEIRKHNHF